MADSEVTSAVRCFRCSLWLNNTSYSERVRRSEYGFAC